MGVLDDTRLLRDQIISTQSFPKRQRTPEVKVLMDNLTFPGNHPAFRIEHQCHGVVARVVGTADDLVRANLRAMCALRDLVGDGAEGNLVVIDQRSSPRGGVAGIHRIDEYLRCHAD